MMESLNGTSLACEGLSCGMAAAKVLAARARANSRRCMMGCPFRSGRSGASSEQLVADILQHIQCALDSYFAGQNRIFVLDAKNSLITHFHVRADDFFPCAGAVPVTHG